jgi:hypothetical protein
VERCASTQAAFDPYSTLVRLDDSFCDVQAESGPTRPVVRAIAGKTEMWLEDRLLLVSRDAWALVAYADPRLLFFSPQAYADLPAIGIFDRVEQQIRQYLCHPFPITGREYRFWRIQADGMAVGTRGRQLNLFAADLCQVARDGLNLKSAGRQKHGVL